MVSMLCILLMEPMVLMVPEDAVLSKVPTVLVVNNVHMVSRCLRCLCCLRCVW